MVDFPASYVCLQKGIFFSHFSWHLAGIPTCGDEFPNPKPRDEPILNGFVLAKKKHDPKTFADGNLRYPPQSYVFPPRDSRRY